MDAQHGYADGLSQMQKERMKKMLQKMSTLQTLYPQTRPDRDQAPLSCMTMGM
jgi:hypothetical protein